MESKDKVLSYINGIFSLSNYRGLVIGQLMVY